MSASAGIHHVTAICRDPANNVAFYTGNLGLRLVKRTVNFDDPSTWHLYYGDEIGRPGTALTFFAWGEQQPPAATATAWRPKRPSSFRNLARLLDAAPDRARHRARRAGETVRRARASLPRRGRHATGPRRREGRRSRSPAGRTATCRRSMRCAAFAASPSWSARRRTDRRSADRRVRLSRPRRARATSCATGPAATSSPRWSTCARRKVFSPVVRAPAPCTMSRSAPPPMRRRPKWSRRSRRRGCTRPTRSIVAISAPSIFESRAASCSRSPPTTRASPWTSRRRTLGGGDQAPAVVRGSPRRDRGGAAPSGLAPARQSVASRPVAGRKFLSRRAPRSTRLFYGSAPRGMMLL